MVPFDKKSHRSLDRTLAVEALRLGRTAGTEVAIIVIYSQATTYLHSFIVTHPCFLVVLEESVVVLGQVAEALLELIMGKRAVAFGFMVPATSGSAVLRLIVGELVVAGPVVASELPIAIHILGIIAI